LDRLIKGSQREARRLLGERALAWLDAALNDFAAAPSGESALEQFKLNGELATAAAIMLDCGENPTARRWLKSCWNRLEDGQLLLRAVGQHPSLAAVYTPFRRHGYKCAELEQTLQTAVLRVEDPPVRLLLACALRSCGLPAPWDVNQLLGESWLAGEPGTWLIDTREAYVITHVALYLEPVGLLAEHHRRYILRSLPVWIAVFVKAGHLDLLAELIMIAHVFGECVPDCEWQVLLDAQEEDGMVPFRLAWRNRKVAPKVRFLANYHSTLVALAAAAMCAGTCGSGNLSGPVEKDR
jgi:hypothetical protein